ncbi:polyketide cyclase [Pseudonocardia sp. ICBG1293]|uniref:polyketide cyclase n=1 Tax=Pseudonocardia sp. ICBG1293 TaxID=2844382 RepID=UPI001CCAC124|nr:polyketide cyclase [Pseudonocardia sp. ICBG1293]
MSDAETLRRYPCDEFVPEPALQAWRGVSVTAPATAVWPWVAQIRLAPYSYDWVDNLGRRSPPVLVGLPDPQVGEAFTATGGRRLGRILAVRPGTELTGTVLGAVMSYVLVPRGPDSTRLLLKVSMGGPRVLAPLLSVGDLVMARRQLLNLRRLAESHGRARRRDDPPGVVGCGDGG